MKFGVAIFPTESVQTPSEIATMAEERGFECLLFPEHTHIPAARETPAQKPHPPVLVGGNGPRVLDRVLAYGDEWMPNRMSDEDLTARIGELNARAAEAGREPIPVTMVGMAADPERIERLGQAGVHRVVFWLPPESADAVEQGFDHYVVAMDQFQTTG